jgi:hypothetical protein
MLFDAQDWFTRLKQAGGGIRVDAFKIWPREGVPLTPECEAIWNEIRGDENQDKWSQVEKLVREKVGPIVGWADL